jgi:hypothetical protein
MKASISCSCLLLHAPASYISNSAYDVMTSVRQNHLKMFLFLSPPLVDVGGYAAYGAVYAGRKGQCFDIDARLLEAWRQPVAF